MLSVRLPESEVRRLKGVAASRGVTVQEAVHEAVEAWTSQLPGSRSEPLEALEGSLADVNVQALMRRDREAELRKDRRRN